MPTLPGSLRGPGISVWLGWSALPVLVWAVHLVKTGNVSATLFGKKHLTIRLFLRYECPIVVAMWNEMADSCKHPLYWRQFSGADLVF